MPELGEITQQKVLVFSLQLVVTLLALGKRAAFFLERLLKIANSFLKTAGHFRYAPARRDRRVEFGIGFRRPLTARFPTGQAFPGLGGEYRHSC